MISTTELRGLIQANEMAGWSQLSFSHDYLLELADRIDQQEKQLAAMTKERDYYSRTAEVLAKDKP